MMGNSANFRDPQSPSDLEKAPKSHHGSTGFYLDMPFYVKGQDAALAQQTELRACGGQEPCLFPWQLGKSK